jgi:hypothetical protein
MRILPCPSESRLAYLSNERAPKQYLVETEHSYGDRAVESKVFKGSAPSY